MDKFEKELNLLGKLSAEFNEANESGNELMAKVTMTKIINFFKDNRRTIRKLKSALREEGSKGSRMVLKDIKTLERFAKEN